MKTITLQIIGMHCTSCAMNIDFELEDIDGIQEATTNYASSQTRITFDPKKISVKKLIDTIHTLKYNAKQI